MVTYQQHPSPPTTPSQRSHTFGIVTLCCHCFLTHTHTEQCGAHEQPHSHAAQHCNQPSAQDVWPGGPLLFRCVRMRVWWGLGWWEHWLVQWLWCIGCVHVCTRKAHRVKSQRSQDHRTGQLCQQLTAHVPSPLAFNTHTTCALLQAKACCCMKMSCEGALHVPPTSQPPSALYKTPHDRPRFPAPSKSTCGTMTFVARCTRIQCMLRTWHCL